MPLSKYDIEADLAREPGTSHAFMIELVGSNKRVLDVGCDTGYLGVNLKALGCTVTGLEVDPVTAQEAAKQLDRVVVADLENVDLLAHFEPGTFDVIVFGDVLEHLRDPLSVLRASRPLLAAGGSVIISTPNVAHADIRLALLQGRWDYTRVGILDETHTRFFTRKSLTDFLTDAGFVLADLRRTHAELFTTETGVSEADFDPGVVAALRADPEADTYQFVVRAVPDDAVNLETATALRLDELTTLVTQLEGALANLQQTVEQKDETIANLLTQVDAGSAAEGRLLARVDEIQHAHDVAVADREQARAELAARDVVPPQVAGSTGLLRRLKRAWSGT